MLYCLSECYIFSKNYEKLLNDSRRSNSPCCQRMRARYSLHGQSRIEGEFDRSLVLHDRTVPDEIFDPVQQFPDASPDVIDMDRIIRPVEIQRTAERKTAESSVFFRKAGEHLVFKCCVACRCNKENNGRQFVFRRFVHVFLPDVFVVYFAGNHNAVDPYFRVDSEHCRDEEIQARDAVGVLFPPVNQNMAVPLFIEVLRRKLAGAGVVETEFHIRFRNGKNADRENVGIRILCRVHDLLRLGGEKQNDFRGGDRIEEILPVMRTVCEYTVEISGKPFQKRGKKIVEVMVVAGIEDDGRFSGRVQEYAFFVEHFENAPPGSLFHIVFPVQNAVKRGRRDVQVACDLTEIRLLLKVFAGHIRYPVHRRNVRISSSGNRAVGSRCSSG